MPHSMDASVLLQTELQCVPTQWLFVDCTRDQRVANWIKDNKEVDYLPFIWPDDIAQNETPPSYRTMKRWYIQRRPQFLQRFSTLYDQRTREGTRGRLVIWFVGDTADVFSALLLSEVPLDISNFCHWRQKFVPAVVRIALGSAPHTTRFLTTLIPQYFHLPPVDVRENTIMSPRLYGNPYDCCFVSESEDCVRRLVDKLLPLHVAESQFAREHWSEKFGSGGKLYLVEGTLVTSVSKFRRVDWLILAQCEYFPRLWELDKPNICDELGALFDYRQWKERFTTRRANSDDALVDDESLNSSEDSSNPSITSSLYVPQRRRRETNWTHILSAESTLKVNTSAVDCDLTTDTILYLEEANELRVTPGDILATKEVVIYLQRLGHYRQSVLWIDTLQPMNENTDSRTAATTASPTLVPFIKLKGVALLKLGEKDSARMLFADYRHAVLNDCEEARLLGRPVTFFSSIAEAYSDVAAISLLESEYQTACDYAVKALQLDRRLHQAYKILACASAECGAGTWQTEELIFHFFVTYLRENHTNIERYYITTTQRHPNNPYYHYFYAIFASLLLHDEGKALPHFKRALAVRPDDPRILESYATFLFQSRIGDDEEIESLYRQALKVAPHNIVILTNTAAFLLASNPTKYLNEGLRLLDKVLYSEGLTEKEPALAVEAWFYALIYKPLDRFAESLRSLKIAMRAGGRALGWDLSMHLSYALKNNHPHLQWLTVLADVLMGHASVEKLRGWEAWQRAYTGHILSESKSLTTDTRKTDGTSLLISKPRDSETQHSKLWCISYSRRHVKAKQKDSTHLEETNVSSVTARLLSPTDSSSPVASKLSTSASQPVADCSLRTLSESQSPSTSLTMCDTSSSSATTPAADCTTFPFNTSILPCSELDFAFLQSSNPFTLSLSNSPNLLLSNKRKTPSDVENFDVDQHPKKLKNSVSSSLSQSKNALQNDRKISISSIWQPYKRSAIQQISLTSAYPSSTDIVSSFTDSSCIFDFNSHDRNKQLEQDNSENANSNIR
jgi:tetratricopeptide (TPR) repeat protein